VSNDLKLLMYGYIIGMPLSFIFAGIGMYMIAFIITIILTIYALCISVYVIKKGNKMS
jgi:heme/copper-type cytochrome/quinol oxidase subunit 4